MLLKVEKGSQSMEKGFFCDKRRRNVPSVVEERVSPFCMNVLRTFDLMIVHRLVSSKMGPPRPFCKNAGPGSRLEAV